MNSTISDFKLAAIIASLATALSIAPVPAGDGGFPIESAGSPFTTAPRPFSLAVGDYDNDGTQDLAVTNSNPETITLHRGVGDGSFVCQPPCLIGTGFYPVSIATGDFNNDGYLDVATANMDDDNVSVRLGAGDGTFPIPLGTTFSGAGLDRPVSIAVGHFNADANLDLAVANYGSDNLSVFLGAGDGTFPTEAPGSAYGIGTGTKPSMVAVGDFNSDGHDDAAVAANGTDDVRVLLGSTFAPGYLEAAVEYAAGDGPRAVAVGDFNSDGSEDLAVANHESANVTVRLGAGDGTFSMEAPDSPLAVGSQPSSIAVGDFNSDGIEDLAVTNEDTDRVSVWLGAGDGGFPTESMGSPFGTGDGPYFAAVGDFNADGNQDLAVANSQGASFTIRLGSGTPLLAGNLIANGGAEGPGAAIGDPGQTPPIPSWTPGLGVMTFIRYSSPGGIPRLIDAARWEGGMNLFSAGNDDLASALTSASQSVDVTAAAAQIDAGLATARLQADLGGFRATNDTMQVSAGFRDGTGQPLGAIVIGPVSASERRNLTRLLRRAQSAPVPTRTRSIVVTLTAIRPSGSVNHAYADNVSLILTTSTTLPPTVSLGLRSLVVKPGALLKLAGLGPLTPADPTTTGAVLAFAGASGGARYELPAACWKTVRKRGSTKGYRCKQAPCKLALLASKGLRAICRGDTGDFGPLPEVGPVDVTLAVGSTSYCGRCGGRPKGKEARIFKRVACEAQPSCP